MGSLCSIPVLRLDPSWSNASFRNRHFGSEAGPLRGLPRGVERSLEGRCSGVSAQPLLLSFWLLPSPRVIHHQLLTHRGCSFQTSPDSPRMSSRTPSEKDQDSQLPPLPVQTPWGSGGDSDSPHSCCHDSWDPSAFLSTTSPSNHSLSRSVWFCVSWCSGWEWEWRREESGKWGLLIKQGPIPISLPSTESLPLTRCYQICMTMAVLNVCVLEAQRKVCGAHLERNRLRMQVSIFKSGFK